MKLDYTLAQMRAQLEALGNLFDKTSLVDPAAQQILDPETLKPLGAHCTLPVLDAEGRGWRPMYRGDAMSMAFYQAVRVEGRDCLMVAEYAMPQRAAASDRDAAAFSRMLAQYGEELRHDYVTGVYNRRYLEEEYLPALMERIACGERVSAALARVDEYAAILADGGRDAADRCLTVAAGILQIAAGLEREKGVLVRLNDGTFLVTAVGTDAAALAQTLRAALADSRRVYSTSLSRRGEFHVSVGAADWGETGSWDLLLALAEQRLANG